MGAGKSTAARDVAAVLGVRHHDTDRLLEARLGQTIEQGFEAHGGGGLRRRGAGSREREEALAVELLENAGAGDVIALGGGSVLSERTRRALERHIAVLLEVDLDLAWKRASGRGRPLATHPAA